MANQSFSSHGSKRPHKYPITFVPHIFKNNTSKPSIVAASDPYLTSEAVKEYSGLLSEFEDKLPSYLKHFEVFTENVLDIPDKVLEDIAKVHSEIEWKLREEENAEEEHLAKKHEVELNNKNNLDNKVTSIMNAHRYFVKRSCPVKIPFKSTLTHEEHEFYLRSFIKFSLHSPSNSLEQMDYDQYMSMQNKVLNEQTCLMNFSYDVAQLLLNEYNFVPPVMDQYIKEYVAHRCQRALSYPECYKNVIEIPLKPKNSVSAADSFQLKYIGHLLSLGSIPWVNLPNPHLKILLPKNEQVANRIRPDCDENYDRETKLYKCPVSEDPNAEFMAKAHNASIVMSASAFKTIVNNLEPPFDNEWNIPIRIKTLQTKDETGEEADTRIIFIDKPLPKKTWTPLQKKSTFFKYSAKVKLTKNLKYSCFRMRPHKFMRPPFAWRDHDACSVDSFSTDRSCSPTPDRRFLLRDPLQRDPLQRDPLQRDPLQRDPVESDLLLSDEDDEPVPFQQKPGHPGPSFPPPSSYHPIKKGTTSKSQKNTASSQKSGASGGQAPKDLDETCKLPPEKRGKVNNDNVGGFLDDLLEKQDTFLKPKSSLNCSIDAASVSSSLGTYDSKPNHTVKTPKPWTENISTEWTDYKLKDCPPQSGTNVHYQLFSFENMEQSPVKKEREQPTRILVRHNVHGLSRFRKGHQSSKAFLLYPKLENQVYFGCEVNNLAEITSQWASLVIRPNTTLLQVRVCIDSGAIVMTEEKQLSTVLKEGKQKHLEFNPQSCFSILNILFNTLKKMSSGQYLLQHTPNTGAFMKLLKASESDQSHFDLHDFYTEGTIATRQYKTAPWLAIDTHVITPFHMLHAKVPATFPMENKRKLSRDERTKRKLLARKKKAIKGYE